jgi:hypothetical protein
MRTLLVVLLAGCALSTAGCGAGSGTDAAGSAPLPVLAAATLPALRTDTHDVSAATLAGETSAPAEVQSMLADWGYLRGRERVFQGESQTLDRVVSRTLEFSSPGGARAYVRYLGTHAGTLYGPGSTARPLRVGARSGYVVDAAACACHRAEPTVLAVLARGTRVTYLEANGGAVGTASVRRLLLHAP